MKRAYFSPVTGTVTFIGRHPAKLPWTPGTLTLGWHWARKNLPLKLVPEGGSPSQPRVDQPDGTLALAGAVC